MEQKIPPIIDKRSLADQVYNYLCDSIIRGHFNYGDTLSTRQLATKLNVSMMPIREALKRLEFGGMVEIKPRSMCVLKTPTKQAILSAIGVRELLEVSSVKTVYQTIEASRLDHMKELIELMEQALNEEPTNIRGYIRYDWEYHSTLCALSDNLFIIRFYKELNLHLNMSYMYDIGIKPNYLQTFKDHIDLIEALEQHDPAAVKIIEKHLRISKQNILSGEFFSELN